MRYFVKSAEVKETTTGKRYKRAKIEGENGIVEVSVWSDYMMYDDVEEGRTVEGVLRTSGKYTNLVNEVQLKGGRRSFDASAAVAMKQEGIQKSQENKEHGIKTSSTIRMAVDVAVALSAGKNWEAKDFSDSITRWRKWFLDNWDVQERGEIPY